MARIIDHRRIAVSMLACVLFAIACILNVQDACADELITTQENQTFSQDQQIENDENDVEYPQEGERGESVQLDDGVAVEEDGSTGNAQLEADTDLNVLEAEEELQELTQANALLSGAVLEKAAGGAAADEPAFHADGWFDEDGSTYYYLNGERQTGWVVDTTYKDYGLQRYWIDPLRACLVFDSLISADEAGYWAYARPEGYVVRGRYQAADGSVYLADNDGRLEDPGWLVTGYYTGGGLQRYYIDEETHACRTGFFEVDGAKYYGERDAGYVVRSTTLRDGKVISANNDGVLFESGWLVTDAMGYGLQRYWFDGGSAAASRLISADEAGYWAYARPEGYVVRGRYQAADGSVYLADNDGRLEDPGWLVTWEYEPSIQRYYIDEETHACRTGFFEADGAEYYGRSNVGYVLRGKLQNGDGVLLADDDGKLVGSMFSQGWLVTDTYDGGYQRYYLDYVCNGHLGATTGFFVVDGYSYYGSTDQGYELRNVDLAWNAYIDNDGIIHISNDTGWLVTVGFGQDLQRYWFKDGIIAANRLISADEAGYWAYARPEGYVVRGRYQAADGSVYLADNDGRLEDPGWLVTWEYEPSIQRYYIDEETHACRTGFFVADGNYYLGLEEVGYVLRGTVTLAGKSYYADDDGCLSLRVSTHVGTESSKTSALINSTFIGQTQYLFLPSHADIENVALEYEAFTETMNCFISMDGVTFSVFESGALFDFSTAEYNDNAYVTYCKISETAAATALRVMISANVASMYILSDDPATYGRSYIEGSYDHSTKTTGNLLMVDPDGTIVYNKALTQIKGRGNTTWAYADKKPYQIKLDKKTDLLETGDDANKAKTWVLLANAFDATMLRNTIQDDLALELGLSVSPENRPVDLYYDGEYRGSYLLSEKVEVKSGRVDIFDLESENEDANPGVDLDALPTRSTYNQLGFEFSYVEGMATPEQYSGGYVIELDDAYYQSERCWFDTTMGHFVLKTPENLSYDEMAYISVRTQQMINACQINATNLSSIIDIDSFAKAYLLNEYIKSPDWGVSSTYFFLPSNEEEEFENVFYAGPVWDGDNAMGLRQSEGIWDIASYSNLFTPRIGSCSLILNDAIEQAMRRIFFEELQPIVLNGLLGNDASGTSYLKGMADYYAEIASSVKMNYVVWDMVHLHHCIKPFATYEQNVSYLETWLSNRLEWFASEMATWPKSDIHIYGAKHDGLDYSLVYDYLYYCEQNPDVAAAYGNDEEAVFNHFLVYGLDEGRTSSRLFNVAAYRSRYGDLQRAYGNDLRSYYLHFIYYGFQEGRIAV